MSCISYEIMGGNVKVALLLAAFYKCFAQDYYDEYRYLMDLRKGTTKRIVDFNQTFFPPLDDYQVAATPATEAEFPWIARVVHSPTKSIPHVCTAVCIHSRIFITASRCIFNLKVNYTSVIYNNTHLLATAFVVPSEPTKQAFDDIGFIVVEPGYTGAWETVELFQGRRTDNAFNWFEDLKLSSEALEHTVVGYANQKFFHKLLSAHAVFSLCKLDVYVGLQMCSEILTMKNLIKGFYIPCYLSCTLKEFHRRSKKCKPYHGVEGGALINIKTNKLLGIATWGSYHYRVNLPVGFSVPNSDNFFKDYACAIRIRDDNSGSAHGVGYYRSLCN